MAQVQIADVVVPAEFTAYQVENSMVSTALYRSGVALPNGEMQAQLQAGAQSFTVPFWSDIPDVEADITNDNPAVLSTAQKISAAAMVCRKSFLHASWSEMSLASELSGSDALVRVQSRVQDYWDRQWEKRLIASLMGVLYSNVANNAGDMVLDIHSLAGTVTLPGTKVTVPANAFNGMAVINTALTIGDRLSHIDVTDDTDVVSCRLASTWGAKPSTIYPPAPADFENSNHTCSGVFASDPDSRRPFSSGHGRFGRKPALNFPFCIIPESFQKSCSIALEE